MDLDNLYYYQQDYESNQYEEKKESDDVLD